MTAKIYLYKLDKEYILREGLGNTGLLPTCRIEKMVKYKNEEAKYQSFAAGRLLVMILSAESGMNQEDIIEILDSDKHSVDGRTVELPSGKLIHYNISHSGKIVTVATSEDSIGIDVEGKDDKAFKVTERMFSEDDKRYIGNSQKKFREVWTSKEAFLKCTGRGIVVPLKSFTMDYENAENIRDTEEFKVRQIRSLGYNLEGRSYYVFTKKTEIEKCGLSICSENKNLLLDMEWVEVLL